MYIIKFILESTLKSFTNHNISQCHQLVKTPAFEMDITQSKQRTADECS